MFSLTSATIFIIVGLLCSIIVYFLKNRELFILASQFPGPFSLPIIGNAYLFLGDTEQIYKKILDIYEKFPDSFRIWLGNRLFIVFSNPAEIKTVLNSPITIDKDGLYLLEPWLGSGLLTAKGDVWKIHRKLIQPAFSQRILLSFVEIFSKYSLILTKKLDKEVDRKEFEVNPYISINALGVILESAMGINNLEDEDASNKYLIALEKTLETVSIRMFRVWLQLDILFKFTKLSKKSEEYLNYLHSYTDNIIQTKREKMNARKVNKGIGVSDDSSKQTKPFLEFLMTLSEEKEILTDLELRNEVDTFLFGGHDTTTTTISFTLLMLASHPDIQAKVYKEIYDIFGSKSPEAVPFKSEHLQEFVYLERVIKETMRLFPVAPIVLRKVTKSFKIGKFTVPKDASIVIPISKIHRDENIWPEPLEFNPDRFSPEEIAKRHPYSYLPFGGGPRTCIGQAFAMMSMKSTLSTIIRKYTLKKDLITPIKDIRLKFDTLLRTVEPISIRIEKRIKD